MSRAPPPSSKPPVSRETVEIVRKKLGPPPGPPPTGLKSNFVNPKTLSNINIHRSNESDYHRRSSDDQDDLDSTRAHSSSYYKNRDSYEEEDSYRRTRRHEDEDENDGFADYPRVSQDNYDSGDEYRNDYRSKPQQRHPDDRRSDRDSRGPRDDIQHSDDDHSYFERRKRDQMDALPSREGSSQRTELPDPKDKKINSKSEKAQSSKQDQAQNESKSGKLPLYDYNPLLKLTYRALKSFTLNPLPKGVLARCYIERNRSGTNMLSPIYTLHAELEDGSGRELMFCRKVIQSFTSHYVFSLKSDDLFRPREQRSKLYLGKLRALTSNDYVLYDEGIISAPEDKEEFLEAMQAGKVPEYSKIHDGKSVDITLYRKELAIIHYNNKTRPAPPGTRGMEVCIPCPKDYFPSSSHDQHKSNTEELVSEFQLIYHLQAPFDRVRGKGKQNELYNKSCLIMHEKASRYDALSSCVVDFKGRAHFPSIKNFHLVYSDPLSHYPNGPSANEMLLKYDSEHEFYFQLAKATDDCYNLDFKYPLSLFQAFAIAISRFDAKLNW